MMTRISFLAAALIASPAFAAGDKLLDDTNLVVLISFILFIAVLLYLKVPKTVGGMLDKRAEGIKAEIDEARALREEAQTILASFERKHKEVETHVEGIIAHAKAEAELAAEVAKEDLKNSIARRLQAAEDQIQSAEDGAVREVKDKAVTIAVVAARTVIAGKMSDDATDGLIDAAITEVGAKLH